MIDDFRGPNRWLSNFEEVDVVYEGVVYPSSEHAYQAAKTEDPIIRKYMAGLPTPRMAKRFGMKLDLREGWDDMKVSVMRTILRDKFKPGSALAARLIATGDQPLVEGNTWGDRFWGVCKGEGLNNLGIILMSIREELRAP